MLNRWSNLYTADQVKAILASKRLDLTLPKRGRVIEHETTVDRVTLELSGAKSTYGKPLYVYTTEWEGVKP
jgi:hypothetical protein